MALSGSVTTDYWYSSGGQSRGYRLDWTAIQSIANNSSVISWSLSTDGTYSSRVAERTLYVVIAGNVVVNKVDRVMRGPGVVASGSFTAYHASDGTFGFTASIEAAVYESTVNCTGSASFTLNQIPRQATIISANDITDEQNPYFTFSNPGGFDLIAEVEVNPTNTHLFSRTIGNTGSYTFELTESERNTLRSYLKNANSGTLRYLLYSNSSQFVSYVDRTLTIANGQPTLTASVEDINPDTVALTGDSSVMVRYASNAAVSMTVEAKKGASITSRRIICGGNYLTTDSGTLEAVESGKFVFSATDSRGNTATQTLDKTLIEYVRLTCLLYANAPNADGEMSFSIGGNCYTGSFGAADNAIHTYYRYKDDISEYGEWIETEVSASNGAYQSNVSVEGLDYTKQYTFQAKISDSLMSAESKEQTVKTVPVFDWSGTDFNFNVPIHVNGIPLAESIISSDGNVAAWKYADGRLTIFGKLVVDNANGYVAQKAVAFPVLAITTKPYATMVTRNSFGNAAAGLSVVPFCGAHNTNSDGLIESVTLGLQTTNGDLGSHSDTFRTVQFVFNGYWK